MSEPHDDAGPSPERVERLIRAARIARSCAIHAALSRVFHRLRGSLAAKPERQQESHPAPC